MNTLDHSYVHARVIVYTQTRSLPSLSYRGFSDQSLDHVRVRRPLSFQSGLPICRELDGAPEQSHLLVSPVPAVSARSPLLIAKLMRIPGVNPHQEILEMAGAGIASPMVLSVIIV